MSDKVSATDTEPESANDSGRVIEGDDTEGHMPFRRNVSAPGPGEALADDTGPGVNKPDLPDDLERA